METGGASCPFFYAGTEQREELRERSMTSGVIHELG